MDTVFHFQSILLGLIGWAATAMAVMSASRVSLNDQRMMIVCSWMIWMIPALGALVYRGIMTTSTAALTCGLTTIAVGAIVLVSAVRPRTRP